MTLNGDLTQILNLLGAALFLAGIVGGFLWRFGKWLQASIKVFVLEVLYGPVAVEEAKAKGEVLPPLTTQIDAVKARQHLTDGKVDGVVEMQQDTNEHLTKLNGSVGKQRDAIHALEVRMAHMEGIEQERVRRERRSTT